MFKWNIFKSSKQFWVLSRESLIFLEHMSVQGRAPRDCSGSCNLRIILVRKHHLIRPPAQSRANFEVIPNSKIRSGLSGSYLVKSGVSPRMEISKPYEHLILLQIRTWKPKTKAPRKSDSASCCHRGSTDNTQTTIFCVLLSAEDHGGLVLLVGDVWRSPPSAHFFMRSSPISQELFLISRKLHISAFSPMP